MSRKVIRDIVIPVVSKLMSSYGIYSGYHLDVHDEILEDYLEQELMIYFNPCGKAGDCEELERLLKEVMQLDETQFDLLIERLMLKYVKLKSVLKKKAERKQSPDRFDKQRKQAKEVWR